MPEDKVVVKSTPTMVTSPITTGCVITNGTIVSISDHVTLYRDPECPYHFSDTPFAQSEESIGVTHG